MKIIILTLLALTITSCDPACYYILRVSENPNVSLTIYTSALLDEDKYKNKILEAATTIINSPDTNSSLTRYIVKLPLVKKDFSIEREINMLVGMGACYYAHKDNTIKELSQKIDSIVIINSDQKIILNNKAKIEMYLNNQIQGFFHQNLVIEAK